MRWYVVRCPVCGWVSPRPIDEQAAEFFRRHRCRDCLARNPFSQVRFEVREIVTNTSHVERKGES
jgi:hypothetical protein